MKIFHNPRCSKSRQTLQLINDANVDIEIIEYLNNTPSEKELEEVLVKLNTYYKKNYNLILIGKSDNTNYQDKLNLIVKKNYQTKNVKFLTNVSEKKLKFYYEKSHLFTMLSKKIGHHFEGFGIVYLEALNFGLPVIISKESGAKDLVNIKKSIKTFNPEKIDKIAREIIRIGIVIKTGPKKGINWLKPSVVPKRIGLFKPRR